MDFSPRGLSTRRACSGGWVSLGHLGAVTLCLWVALVPGCRNGKPSPADARTADSDAPPASAGAPESAASIPPADAPPLGPVRIDADDPDRWVFAERIREDSEGGWVTGSFDAGRNRLDIRTQNVTRFAVDTSRVPINWQRLVVIGIDGRNTELRRRNQDVLHFQLDPHNRWVVAEP